ncbi:Nn.00g083570.m01.CDS01 [Neocucurbitaria sp. VM-36]
MATGSKVHLEASQQPQFYVKGLTAESAEKTSKLLQVNHEKHHIFFNRSGFHNHIAHHLLTLFALNASPAEIQKGYDVNVSYQRPPEPLKVSIVDDMHDPEQFKKYLGKDNYYHDFLVFFQKEFEAKGWQNVVNEYLFAGDERADDMLVRLFGGFLHPIIHLGFGIEFQQPAILAEGLAQAAVHDNWMASLFLGCEKAAEVNRGKDRPKKTIVQLLEECKKDEKLSKAPHWGDGNKIREGILQRAPEEMIKYASQYTIDEDELEEKTAEMINATVYYTAASQHPPHQIKYDFFYMHCVNCSIFFSNFLSAANSFLTPATKRRLLEWKVWNDITMYVSRGCPPLLLDEITKYEPKHDSGWDDIIKRVNVLEDDGHASKLIRALASGEQVCQEYGEKDGFMIDGDAWLKLGHMAIDSVEAEGPNWVRSCGFDEAWEQIPLREGEGARL